MEGAVASSAGRERPIGFIGLMRNRNYALLWWGQLVSEVGNRFHWVAVSLWVYSATGSAGSVSLAVASMFAGSLLVGLWAGVLVDRWDRRKILVVSDLVRGALVALIPSLMGISVWLVYADLVLISVATAFFRPAMFAIIPMVVTQRHLLSANSFFTAVDTGTEIFGPVLAGLLAFKYKYAPLMYFDAISYVVSATCMSLLAVSRMAQDRPAGVARKPAIAELVEGFAYIRRDNLQWQLFLLIFPAYLVGSTLNSLQTPLAKGEVGITDAEFGVFQGVWGAGLLAGSLLLGWLGSGTRRSVSLVGGFMLQFVAAAAMGMSTSFTGLAASSFWVGLGNTLAVVSLATILMEATPEGIIGRVVSLRQTALSCVRMLAPLLFGPLADVVGVRETVLALVGVGAVGTLAVAFWNPALWRFDSNQGVPMKLGHGIGKLAIARYSPEFDAPEQVRLNVLAGILMLLGVGILAYASPLNAAGFVASVCLSVGFGVALRAGKATRRRSIERTFGRLSKTNRAHSRGTVKPLVEQECSRTGS